MIRVSLIIIMLQLFSDQVAGSKGNKYHRALQNTLAISAIQNLNFRYLTLQKQTKPVNPLKYITNL